MSQVRNLRAMFENKGETSPPDRGRVPALQPQASDPPGPLSRVRTSFITVEKGGRVGLQRDNSTDSDISQARKVSGGSEGETVLTQTDATSTTAGESAETQAKPAVAIWRANVQTPDEPMKPFPLRTPSPKAATDTPVPATASALSQAKASVLASAPVITPLTTSKHDAPKLSPEKMGKTASRSKFPEKAAVKAQSELSSVKTTSTVKEVTTSSGTNVAKHTGASATPTTAAKTKTASGIKGKDAPKPAATTATSPVKAKASKSVPKAISTAAHSKPEKKPVTAPLKTPTSPNKTRALKHVRTPERKTPVPSEKVTPKSTTSSTSRSTASSSSKKPSAIHTFSPNGAASVKPKPRSPTRPVQLPAGLATHTAASATKANVTRQTQSRQAGNYDSAHQPMARASSRASMATVATTATKSTHRGLRRQNSTIGRPRPSIGPPPKQPARDHPVLKKEKDVDESFLARMMRPTQSSASKTADKSGAPHTSPPRKHSAGPVKRSAHNGHSPVSKRPESALHDKKLASTPPPSTPTPAGSASVTPKSTGDRATSSGNASPAEKVSPVEEPMSVEKASPAEETSVVEAVKTTDVPEVVEQTQPEEAAHVATPEPVSEPAPEPIRESAVAQEVAQEEVEPAAADAVAQEQTTEVVELAQPESDATLEISTPIVIGLGQEDQEGKGAEVIEVTV